MESLHDFILENHEQSYARKYGSIINTGPLAIRTTNHDVLHWKFKPWNHQNSTKYSKE